VRDAYEERDAKNIIFILPDEVSHTISQGANRSDEIHVIPVVVAADGNLNRPIQAIVENIFRKRDTSTILGYDVRRVANTVRRHPTSDFIFTRGDMVLGQQFRARRRAQGADLI
jgi:hypothetical protein